MKLNRSHFKFDTKGRRFNLTAWKKYYTLKKKEKLSDFDRYYLKNFRAKVKTKQYKLIGIHTPTKTRVEWIIKNDKKFDRNKYIHALLVQVKANRKSRTVARTETRNFDGAGYGLVGKVFTKPGQINEIAKYTNTNNPLAKKSPRRKDRNYIGVELEFLPHMTANHNQNSIAAKLKEAGLARFVDVGTDASCGFEVRVLLLEDEFETNLKKILDVINGMGFQVDKHCGTHVHFDMRQRDVKIVYGNLFKLQKLLRKFLTRERKYNKYCKMNKLASFDEQAKLADRRHAINVEAYHEQKTLEVRMHQGTLKENEIVPWIKFLLKIINYKAALVNNVNTLKQAKKQFDIEPNLVKNLEDRIVYMFKNKEPMPPPPPQGARLGQGAFFDTIDNLFRR